FFSSRRRHTRFSRDWSSDVCSSDLLIRLAKHGVIAARYAMHTSRTWIRFFRSRPANSITAAIKTNRHFIRAALLLLIRWRRWRVIGWRRVGRLAGRYGNIGAIDRPRIRIAVKGKAIIHTIDKKATTVIAMLLTNVRKVVWRCIRTISILQTYSPTKSGLSASSRTLRRRIRTPLVRRQTHVGRGAIRT